MGIAQPSTAHRSVVAAIDDEAEVQPGRSQRKVINVVTASMPVKNAAVCDITPSAPPWTGILAARNNTAKGAHAKMAKQAFDKSKSVAVVE
jgi:hypothetical protein